MDLSIQQLRVPAWNESLLRSLFFRKPTVEMTFTIFLIHSLGNAVVHGRAVNTGPLFSLTSEGHTFKPGRQSKPLFGKFFFLTFSHSKTLQGSFHV